MSTDNAGPAWVAAYGLAGTLTEVPSGPLDPAAWAELIGDVTAAGLSGHLLRAVDDGALTVRSAQRGEVADAHLAAMTTTLVLEQRLLDHMEALASNGVDVRVLQGPTLAHLDYPDPTLRPYTALSLLVRRDEFSRAADVLLAQGCLPRRSVPPSTPVAALGAGAALVDPSGLEIGLSYAFARGSIGLRVRLDDMWRDEVCVYTVGGTPVPTVALEYRLLFTCYDAALAGARPTLGAMRDVAQIMLSGAPDAAAVRRLAAAWHGEAVVATAIRAAWRTLQLADVLALSAWARGLRIDARDERELRATAAAESSERALAEIRSAARLRDKARYAMALARSRGQALGRSRQRPEAWS